MIAKLRQLLAFLPDNASGLTVLRRELSGRIVRPFTRQDYQSITYTDRDWDNLIILDACRYDTFDRHNPFDSQPDRVHSNASHTREFLEKNFTGDHRDTVYISASPQLVGFEEHFAHVEHVWQDHWDDEMNTVLPETMVEQALQLADDHPDKKLIIHFMQPHYPFIGENGQQIEQGSFREDREQLSIWEQLYAHAVDPGLVEEAYEENLEIVLPHVQQLVEKLSGRTVVTSDHGNLFGETVCPLPIKIYGHPYGLRDSELTAVPWIELEGDRREVTASEESGGSTVDEAEVRERLEKLGYT